MVPPSKSMKLGRQNHVKWEKHMGIIWDGNMEEIFFLIDYTMIIHNCAMFGMNIQLTICNTEKTILFFEARGYGVSSAVLPWDVLHCAPFQLRIDCWVAGCKNWDQKWGPFFSHIIPSGKLP
jgi:hypothetical protein